MKFGRYGSDVLEWDLPVLVVEALLADHAGLLNVGDTSFKSPKKASEVNWLSVLTCNI